VTKLQRIYFIDNTVSKLHCEAERITA